MLISAKEKKYMRPKSASSVRSLRAVGCSVQAYCSLQSLIVGRGS